MHQEVNGKRGGGGGGYKGLKSVQCNLTNINK